jgi:type I restriction enzyme R subunit
MAQSELINKILHTDYLDSAGINEFENIRESLRGLMKYIPHGGVKYTTNFTDEILSTDWHESELENDDLRNYKAKAEFYIRQHQDNTVIAKLKTNVPLTKEDVKTLEEILWSEVGTKQDYEAECGQKPLGEFVREIVGLDMNAAKAAFAEYLNNTSLDSRQIHFVNQIVEYIVHNGLMKDLSVLQESPFTDRGSIVEVFTDLSVWVGIRKAIEQINANAVAA